MVRSLFCEATAVLPVSTGRNSRCHRCLHHARLETGLPDGCGLLIAGHAADRYCGAKQSRIGHAHIGGAVANLGKEAARYIQKPEQSSSQLPLWML